MAVATFYLEDFKTAGYSKDRLAAIVPSMGVEIEEMDDKEFSIDVTPNRPDLLDFVGLLRALNNFTEKSAPKDGFYKVTGEPLLEIRVTNAAAKARPYIAGMVVKGADLSGNRLKYLINFTEKFADTYGRKRKKLAIGIHSLSAIKPGGGLVYDAARDGDFVPLNETKGMRFSEIMRKNEKGLAYGPALPGFGTGDVIYPLLKDSEKVLALIPITNAEATRVTERTKDLFIDITGTSGATTRNAAALIAASFIYAHCEVYPVVVIDEAGRSEITPDMSYMKIKVAMSKMDKTLGIETGRHDVIGLGNRMGYTGAKYGNSVLFSVPPYRVDVLNEQDVIEDVAIAYGYDKIVPLPIVGYAEGLADEVSEYENRIALFAVGLGFTEAVNSTLTNERVNFDMFGHRYAAGGFVSIADAKTVNVSMLRTHLLPGLLQNLGGSMNERLPQRVFEIGRAFTLDNGRLKESVNLCIVSEHAKANFAEVRGVVDALLGSIGMGPNSIAEYEDPAFIGGRCAKIVKDGETIGYFGEVHPKVLGNFGLEEPVVAIELKLIKEIKYKV